MEGQGAYSRYGDRPDLVRGAPLCDEILGNQNIVENPGGLRTRKVFTRC